MHTNFKQKDAEHRFCAITDRFWRKRETWRGKEEFCANVWKEMWSSNSTTCGRLPLHQQAKTSLFGIFSNQSFGIWWSQPELSIEMVRNHPRFPPSSTKSYWWAGQRQHVIITDDPIYAVLNGKANYHFDTATDSCIYTTNPTNTIERYNLANTLPSKTLWMRRLQTNTQAILAGNQLLKLLS